MLKKHTAPSLLGAFLSHRVCNNHSSSWSPRPSDTDLHLRPMVIILLHPLRQPKTTVNVQHNSGRGILTQEHKARVTSVFSRRVSNRLKSSFQGASDLGGCECDERVLINQDHRFVVLTRCLPVFLCFESSSLLPSVFAVLVRILANRCLGKGIHPYPLWCVLSVYSSVLVFPQVHHNL